MRIRQIIGTLLALIFFLAAKSASAQATRTWVSGVGDDANPCSRTAPCKTFAGAISKTAAAGTISALDPAGFGQVTITKAITIDARGTMGSILNGAANGINISAGATDTVILRGLAIQGVTTAAVGIQFTSGKSLQVEDCLITGQTTAAINFSPAAAATLFLKNVTAINNTAGLIVGGLGNATVVSSHFFQDVVGVRATASGRIILHDTFIGGNSDKGLFAEGTMSDITMNRGLISGNGIGVQGDAPVRLSDVMIGHNTTGIAGAQVKSFGNNRVAAGNGTDGAPSGTLPQQ